MTKALNEFGGWLKFYYVLSIIHLVFSAMGLLTIVAIMTNLLEIHDTVHPQVVLTLFFRNVGVIAFLAFIIKFLKKQDSGTPGKIIRLIQGLSLYALIFAYISKVQRFQFEQGLGSEGNPNTRHSLLVLFIFTWALVWIMYFKKSKRVAAYYGLK